MKTLRADVAIGVVTVKDDDDELVEHRVGLPCLIHVESGTVVWQGDPTPVNIFGLQLSGAVLKQFHNDMRRNKHWHEVWAATDWTVLSQIESPNRRTRRAHGVK